MLQFIQIPKNEISKISVAIVELNGNTNNPKFNGELRNLAMVYHQFIDKYVLLIKENNMFSTDNFLVLKKSKDDSLKYLQKSSIIRKVSSLLKLNFLHPNNRTFKKKSKIKSKNKSKKYISSDIPK